jgi:virulence factor Mce-like protein
VLKRVGGALVRYPLPVLGLVVTAVLAWVLVGTRSEPHHITAEFDSALSIANGLDVQIDGVDVGKVADVKYEDGHAIVKLGIDDKDWPIRQGSKVMLRYGTTLGNGTRFAQILPGPANAPAIPEDGIIQTKDTITPVEFDQIFNTFGKGTRSNLRGMLDGTATTLTGRRDELNAGLKGAAPAFEGVQGVLSDLATDQAALRGLVANAHKATRVLGARGPEISDLMTVMAATFDKFAVNARNIRQSLDQFSPTLVDMRQTMGRMDTSVDKLDAMVADLKPGARDLKPFLRSAQPAVERLAKTAPLLDDAVTTLRRSGPDLTAFLAEGVPFSGRLKTTLSGLAPALNCIRPYAPDITGFFMNWASWGKNYDAIDHYGRVQYKGGATIVNGMPPIKTSDFLNTLGAGLSYAMPRPPGLNAGKPYFLPECGAGPNALDPTKDPEDQP